MDLFIVVDHFKFILTKMTPLEIIIFSLSLSFCITHVWKPVNFKPFNCMMCLTGWVAWLAGDISYHTWYTGLLFFPVGCFAGAMVESAMMRYL